jgi:hypothetical protein
MIPFFNRSINHISEFLDFNLDLLKSDLHRNSQAKDSILAKITDIESPTTTDIINDLNTREKILRTRIESVLKQNEKLKHNHAKINSRSYSFKNYFTVMIIINVVIIGSLLVYTDTIIKTETNTILDDRYDKLDLITTYVEKELLGLNSVMESSSLLPQVQDVSFANLMDKNLHGIPQDADMPKRDVANNILRTNNNIRAIFFALPNGDMYMTQPYYKQENLIDNNFAFRDWYKGVTNTHETYISESYVSQVDNEKAIAVATPVRSDGKDVGIFVAVYDLSNIISKLEQFTLEENERVIFMDQNANIIYDSQSTIRDGQISKIPNDILSDVLNGKHVHKIQKTEDIEFMIIADPIPVIHNNWTVMSVQPYHDMFAKITTTWDNTMIIIVLVSGSSFGSSVILLRTKSKPNKIVIQHNKIEVKPPLSTDKTNNPIQKILTNKKAGTIIICVIVSLVIFNTYVSLTKSDLTPTELKSGYVIHNLKGDTIDTWLSWRLVDGTTLNVNLIDGEKYPDTAQIVRDVILSNESIEIDNSLLHKGPKGTASTYYMGWTGALANTMNSKFYIPHKFNIIESSGGEGDITIRLTSQSSGDGYSGFTKSIADDAQNQILKSEITIYNMDKLSKAEFETILRHEFGHALGLAHSTATEDLMYPTITTEYPYISGCDIDAIVSLYDGGKKSEVTCEI